MFLKIQVVRHKIKHIHFTVLRHLCSENSKWLPPSGYNTNIGIYNCIVQKKVPLILKNPNMCTWYMCGPTVYDSAHLGHACCYMKFDIIRRILKHFNINVVMMMGVTDIDDKIIARALERKDDPKKLAVQYEQEFFEDLRKLNILPPTIITRVTDFVPHIINFVQRIIDKGQAYVTEDGSVYFNTSEYSRYGKLCSSRKMEDTSENESSHSKRAPQDFCLWKASKPGEPWWQSPWGPGRGRPGWHIECSTMASHVFGNNIDLHSGGIDLLFPHHENEEAQSCAHHGVDQWVNYWMHSGHLHVKGKEKMSKSLKNTISINDFLKSYTPNQFRIFCLQSPYRSGMEYADKSMQNAVAITKKIESFLVDSESYIQGFSNFGNINEALLLQALADAKNKVHAGLSDDFNTATAMNALMELMAVGNKMLHQMSEHEGARHPAAVAATLLFVKNTMEMFGVDFSLQKTADVHDAVQLKQIVDGVVEFRNQVRLNALQLMKDIKTQDGSLKKVKTDDFLNACDNLRDLLHKSGISVKDHGKMSTWTFDQTEKRK